MLTRLLDLVAAFALLFICAILIEMWDYNDLARLALPFVFVTGIVYLYKSLSWGEK